MALQASTVKMGGHVPVALQILRSNNITFQTLSVYTLNYIGNYSQHRAVDILLEPEPVPGISLQGVKKAKIHVSTLRS
jgi:hypothetical protein